MTHNAGTLVISLDFELYWGMLDIASLDEYGANVRGAREVVPQLLAMFRDYEIHATWAIVGLLYFASHEELLAGLPAEKPAYANPRFSPYEYLTQIGTDEADDPYHYAPSLIRQIQACPHQEIGTHTFAHYYCLERGQSVNEFRADLLAALAVEQTFNVRSTSLIFPRNQCNDAHLAICRELGITAYRGTESATIYQARSREDERLVYRGLRLMDAYINISSHNAYAWDTLRTEFPVNIPASRFLRPYSQRLKFLEPLRLQRIKSDLTYAARNGLVYHLWWHPHNFGVDIAENMAFLAAIFEHYADLRQQHGMTSRTMGEVAEALLEPRANPIGVSA